jgi:hypothetical protein
MYMLDSLYRYTQFRRSLKAVTDEKKKSDKGEEAGEEDNKYGIYICKRQQHILLVLYGYIYTGGVYTHVIVVFIIGTALLRSSRSLLLGFGRAEALYYTLYIHTKSLSITSVSYCR